MLYFDIRNTTVWTENPPNMGYNEIESFTPTRPELKHGFLLWYDYTNYDSYGESPGINYCIVDLYEKYESAAKMAGLIREYLDADYRYLNPKSRPKDEVKKDFFFAATTDRIPHLPLEWGTSVRDTYVDEVEIKDLSDKMKRQRIF